MPLWYEFLIRTSIVRSDTVSPRHDVLPDPNNLLTFFQKGVRYNQLAAEIHPKDGCGDPNVGAYSVLRIGYFQTRRQLTS